MDVKSKECEKDMDDYKTCLFEQIIKYSPTAKVFCLVHQMDLVPKNQRKMVSKTKMLVINRLYQVLFPLDLQKERGRN